MVEEAPSPPVGQPPTPLVEEAPPAPSRNQRPHTTPLVEEAPPAPSRNQRPHTTPLVEEAPPAPSRNQRPDTWCTYYNAGVCRSCTLLPIPYADQLAAKDARIRRLLSSVTRWDRAVSSSPQGFRNKAKMVVGGTVDAPTVGLVDADLRDCGLHDPRLAVALPALADFITTASLRPYDIAGRAGELKHLLVTLSPDGELMVRFVLRSTEAESRIRKHLPHLVAVLPTMRVVSLNIQAEHKAIIEGPREIVLTSDSELPMRINDLTLKLRPQSFFQTNTAIAAALYRTADEWTADLPVSSVLDLYCGVGGFTLHLARHRHVVGVEVSTEAVESARSSALKAGLPATFVATDATAYLMDHQPDLVVVNPPRRGIGPDLARRLESSGVPYLLYSSCNPESLARDVSVLRSYEMERAQVFDMFPNTEHAEVLVLLRRR